MVSLDEEELLLDEFDLEELEEELLEDELDSFEEDNLEIQETELLLVLAFDFEGVIFAMVTLLFFADLVLLTLESVVLLSPLELKVCLELLWSSTIVCVFCILSGLISDASSESSFFSSVMAFFLPCAIIDYVIYLDLD